MMLMMSDQEVWAPPPSLAHLPRAQWPVISPYAWNLRDLPPPAPDAPTVLSTFSCGGGSSMGYKLAGCRMLGAVDIDPRMMALYVDNLHPPVHLIGVTEWLRTPDRVCRGNPTGPLRADVLPWVLVRGTGEGSEVCEGG